MDLTRRGVVSQHRFLTSADARCLLSRNLRRCTLTTSVLAAQFAGYIVMSAPDASRRRVATIASHVVTQSTNTFGVANSAGVRRRSSARIGLDWRRDWALSTGTHVGTRVDA
jgi:hypothetical protein